MAVNDVLFCLHGFLLKENNSAANIFDRLCHVEIPAWVLAGMQHWVKHFKDGNRDIVNLACSG
jgi:hypothetical protein